MAVPTRSPVRRWLRRIFKTLAVALVLALVAGLIYETLARRRSARDFPAPGELVDLGTRRIHLDCRGQGTPIVVFEAGLDTYGSLSWSPVHDSIAATTRACAYDRAGVMWSDPSPDFRSGIAVAQDLHAALAVSGESGPFVLVGHSLGGPYSMIFTKYFPDQVAGLVFVDASHPDQFHRFAEITGEVAEPPLGVLRVLRALAPTGLPRLLSGLTRNAAIPDSINRTLGAYFSTSLGPMIDEAASLEATVTEAGTFRTLGNRPLVVLTAMQPLDSAGLSAMKMTAEQGVQFRQVWKTLHIDQANWSSVSRHELYPEAGHYIQIDRPDAVIRAVRDVVSAIRTGTPLVPVAAADSGNASPQGAM